MEVSTLQNMFISQPEPEMVDGSVFSNTGSESNSDSNSNVNANSPDFLQLLKQASESVAKDGSLSDKGCVKEGNDDYGLLKLLVNNDEKSSVQKPLSSLSIPVSELLTAKNDKTVVEKFNLMQEPNIGETLNLKIPSSRQGSSVLPEKTDEQMVRNLLNLTPKQYNVDKVDNVDKVNPVERLRSSQFKAVMGYGKKQDIIDTNIIKKRGQVPLIQETHFGQTVRRVEKPVFRSEKNFDDTGLKSDNVFELVGDRQINVGRSVPAPIPVQRGDASPIMTSKVLDISHLDISDSSVIIEKISNYIEQNNFKTRSGLELFVKHDSIGHFKLNVHQMVGNGEKLNLEIMSSSKKGHLFFTENENKLVQSLISSGLKIADIKIGMAGNFSVNTNTENGNRNFSFNHESFGKQGGFQHNENQEQADSRRRRELWEDFKERYGT